MSGGQTADRRRPGFVKDWSPESSARLGADMLTAVLEMLPRLTEEEEEEEEEGINVQPKCWLTGKPRAQVRRCRARSRAKAQRAVRSWAQTDG